MNILSFPFHLLYITWDKNKLPQMQPLSKKQGYVPNHKRGMFPYP